MILSNKIHTKPHLMHGDCAAKIGYDYCSLHYPCFYDAVTQEQYLRPPLRSLSMQLFMYVCSNFTVTKDTFPS